MLKPDILNQFFLDVPRIDVYLEGISCKDPEYILTFLNKKLGKDMTDDVIYCLTQTFMADFYIEEYKKRDKNSEFLLDHNKYKVDISTDNKTVNITKNFKLVYFDDEDLDIHYIIDFYTLNITVDLTSKINIYSWNSDFEKNNQVIINSRSMYT